MDQMASIKVSDPGYVAKGSDLYIKSMQNLGLPYNRDFNDGDQYGVGLMQYTIGDGKGVIPYPHL
jgi:choline dehydrogenase